MWFDHPSEDVRKAIVVLDDALSSWERSTGKESVLILREHGGFEHRAVNGKPVSARDVEDENLLALIK